MLDISRFESLVFVEATVVDLISYVFVLFIQAPWHNTSNWRTKTYDLWPANEKIKNTQDWAENFKAQNRVPSAEVESEDGEGNGDEDEQEEDDSMDVDGDERDASSDGGQDGGADHVATVKVDPVKALAEYISLYDEAEWLASNVQDRWQALLEKVRVFLS